MGEFRLSTGVVDTSSTASDRAQLLSLSTALGELTERLTGVADRYAGTERDDVAIDLYEVERALRGADRRLQRLLQALR